MLPDGRPARDPGEQTVMLRRRRVPQRVFGSKLVVARPRDGAPVVMAPTAAVVWQVLDDWTTPGEMDRRLAEAFPDVPEEDRVTARIEILRVLQDDDLIERS
jgi:hypothetical protein